MKWLESKKNIEILFDKKIRSGIDEFLRADAKQ